MSDSTRQFVRCRTQTSHRLPGRDLFLPFCLFLLFALGGSTAAGADAPSPPAGSTGPGLPFAIGDFDGDLRPDLASIQVGQSDCCPSDYWIQLRLTSTGRQFIRLVAPVGGLQIDARDVNGDDALDLVVTTAWLKQPVSILLNDGRGHFSVVDPSAFPATFGESERNWAPAVKQITQAVAISPRSRNQDGSKASRLAYGQSVAHFIWASSSESPFGAFLIPYRGRAPPSQAPFS